MQTYGNISLTQHVLALVCWPSRARTVVGQALFSPFGFLLARRDDASRALSFALVHQQAAPFQ